MVAKRFALTVARQMYRAAGVPADEARRLAFDGAWTPGAALFALRCENRRRIDGKGTRKCRGLWPGMAKWVALERDAYRLTEGGRVWLLTKTEHGKSPWELHGQPRKDTPGTELTWFQEIGPT
jgi:hypothetical protein